jgi:hypothetical protein
MDAELIWIAVCLLVSAVMAGLEDVRRLGR